MRIPFAVGAGLFCLFAACGGPPGFLNTDVLEPSGFGAPNQQGVKIQGTMFLEGTLTFGGRGGVSSVYSAYIEAMRGAGWNPSSSEGDPSKELTGKLIKDTRALTLNVKAANEGTVVV